MRSLHHVLTNTCTDSIHLGVEGHLAIDYIFKATEAAGDLSEPQSKASEDGLAAKNGFFL